VVPFLIAANIMKVVQAIEEFWLTIVKLPLDGAR